MAFAMIKPVAEQLREQLDVRRLAAAGTGPENSKSGWRTCISRTLPVDTLGRSKSGIERKKSQFARSASRSGVAAAC